MAFDVQQIIRLARQMGADHEQLAQEIGGMGSVDPQQHGELLQRFGIDPQRLMSGGYDDQLQQQKSSEQNEGGFPQDRRIDEPGQADYQPQDGSANQSGEQDQPGYQQGEFYQEQAGYAPGGNRAGDAGRGGPEEDRPDDETELEERAGLGPKPGEGHGGYGQQAGFMNG